MSRSTRRPWPVQSVGRLAGQGAHDVDALLLTFDGLELLAVEDLVAERAESSRRMGTLAGSGSLSARSHARTQHGHERHEAAAARDEQEWPTSSARHTK